MKKDAAGNPIKLKSRLVVQGFSQRPGFDYNLERLYAPVVRLEALRIVLSIAAILNWEIEQVDVVGTYLNAELDEDIYMRQPDGFDDGTGRVCKLLKGLYGLKQSGFLWHG